MLDWYTQPVEGRAPKGGEELFDHFYRGGEFSPFYIPRQYMPQVDESYYGQLCGYADACGLTWRQETLSPNQIRKHQRIQIDKAVSMDAETLSKPILISRDNYILDGNHRWAKHAALGTDVAVYQFDLDFEAAIKFLFSFPHTYYYGDGDKHPISH